MADLALATRPVRAFLGHHKCGTRWIGDTLEDLCRLAGWQPGVADDDGAFGGAGMVQWAGDMHVDLVILCNARADTVTHQAGFRGFHVIRDPRDLVVSAYWSHRHSHRVDGWPGLAELRARLEAMSVEDGISLEIDFMAGVLEAMGNWDYARPDILELRLEDLTASPEVLWLTICDFLGLVTGRPLPLPAVIGRQWVQSRRRIRVSRGRSPLTPEMVAATVDRHSFERKAGRPRGVVDVQSHYRSGTAGGWREAFTEEHQRLFEDRYPGLITALGYSPADFRGSD